MGHKNHAWLSAASGGRHRWATILTACLAFLAPEAVSSSPTFQRVQLTDKFWSEGVAVADINRDGAMDLIAPPYWYAGPLFKSRHEIFPATQTFSAKRDDGSEVLIEGYEGALGRRNAYSNVFLAFAYDLNGDDWTDVLTVGFPGKEAVWYENPGRESADRGAHWRQHVAFDRVGNESPAFVDLLGESKPVLLCMSGDFLGYAEPDWRHPENKWIFHRIGTPRMLREYREQAQQIAAGLALDPQKGLPDFQPFIHGLGLGDVNSDGRRDALEPEGWWEQPPSIRGDPPWRFHRWTFLKARADKDLTHALKGSPNVEQGKKLLEFYAWPYVLTGSQMYAQDVTGDNRPDVITAIDAHGYGLAWFEQLSDRDANGDARFEKHFILSEQRDTHPGSTSFTQLHAVDWADINGDGLKDIITGKRYWAHGSEGADPESNSAAVLYWFEQAHSANHGVEFIPHLVDSDSGVGLQVRAVDVNGDQLPDIIVSNKKGTFVFLQEKR